MMIFKSSRDDVKLYPTNTEITNESRDTTFQLSRLEYSVLR